MRSPIYTLVPRTGDSDSDPTGYVVPCERCQADVCNEQPCRCCTPVEADGHVYCSDVCRDADLDEASRIEARIKALIAADAVKEVA